eukprot:IDg4143t1
MLGFCASSTFLRRAPFRQSNSSPRRRRKAHCFAPTMLDAGPRLGAPVLDSDVAKKSASFEKWLQENDMYLSKEATWGKPKHPLAISNKTTDEGEPSGRGLERAIRTIPELPDHIDDYMAIATLLIRERGLDGKSFWKPYMDILPSDEEMIPLFRWTAEELALLEGSPSLAGAKNLSSKLDAEFKVMNDTVFSQNRTAFPEDVFTRAAWDWAPSKPQPFCSSFIDVGETSLSGRKFVTLYTDRPYGQMSQVFVSYGPKSNSLLLLLYGFVVDRNPYDSVDITVALREDDPLWERKKKYLLESGVNSVATFPLFRDRYPMELIEYLRFCFAVEEEMDQADFGDFISTRNETLVANALVDGCRDAIDSYPQTIEDDEKLMADRRMYMMLDQKRRWAIRQRLSEKRILRCTMLNIEKEMTDPTFMFVTSGENE